MDVSEVIRTWDIDGEVRLALVFDGTVQGVGFRWTTQSLANEAGIAGWVRNEPNGTVTAEMQGTGHAICQVLASLRDQYANARSHAFLRAMNLHFTVTSCERRACRQSGDKPSFEVRY